MNEPTPLHPGRSGRGAALRPLVDRRGNGGRLGDIVRVDPKSWVEAIERSLLVGTGLLISSTSDGGAVSITVYEGSERRRSYCATADELTEALAAVRDSAESRM